MKLEFLETGSPDCPLIRLFGTDCEDFLLLAKAFAELAEGQKTRLELKDMLRASLAGNCTLSFAQGSLNDGPVSWDGGKSFVWSQKTTGWAEAADLVRPFADSGSQGKYQWIGGEEIGQISVLLSFGETGHW